MIKKHLVNQNSEEWLELRKGKVTASNAHLLIKKGKNAAIGSNEVNTGSNFWCDRGHILEKEAIEVYEAVTGDKVEEVGFITNEDYPDCGYSPDGMAKRLLEVKAFAEEKHLACLKELPNAVYCQIQFGMMVAGEPEIDVVFYNPDIEDSSLCFKIKNVKRDDELIKRFEEKLK